MATSSDVLRAAASEIGYRESPAGSNRTKFAAEAGHPNAQPWCATFLCAIAKRTGLKLPANTASVYYLKKAFQGAGRYSATPAVGDVVIYDFSHTGILESFTGSTVTVLEGNTSSGTSGSQSNGGGVYRRVRSRSLVSGYGHPVYSAPIPPPPAPAPLTEVRPMFSPPLQIAAVLDCPTGGMWAVAPDGAIYAFGGAPYLGGANGKDYFAGRTAARLELVDGKYRIIATSGEPYGPGF